MLNPAPRAGFDENVPALGPPRLFDWTPIRLRLRSGCYSNSQEIVNWDDDFGTILPTPSSPILAGGHLILQRDGDSTNANLVALAPATGKTVWESPRPLAGACYSTPMVWRHDGIEELMVQG